MELNYLKDHLFDLLNESDCLSVTDIEANDTHITRSASPFPTAPYL